MNNAAPDRRLCFLMRVLNPEDPGGSFVYRRK